MSNLIQAILDNDLEAVKVLIKNGSNVNATNKDGNYANILALIMV